MNTTVYMRAISYCYMFKDSEQLPEVLQKKVSMLIAALHDSGVLGIESAYIPGVGRASRYSDSTHVALCTREYDAHALQDEFSSLVYPV